MFGYFSRLSINVTYSLWKIINKRILGKIFDIRSPQWKAIKPLFKIPFLLGFSFFLAAVPFVMFASYVMPPVANAVFTAMWPSVAPYLVNLPQFVSAGIAVITPYLPASISAILVAYDSAKYVQYSNDNTAMDKLNFATSSMTAIGTQLVAKRYLPSYAAMLSASGAPLGVAGVCAMSAAVSLGVAAGYVATDAARKYFRP